MKERMQLWIPQTGADIPERVSSILSCNQHLNRYGLSLSLQQALILVQGCQASIQESRRIEFHEGITAELIRVFSDSPYLSQSELMDTILELTDLFYTLKNDTCDQIGDQELIAFMKDAFDGECHGVMELLVQKGMELSESVHEALEVRM
ncbi:MAG: DUF6323 family protein [Bulleidia sp.]